ncbi:polycystin-1-like [Elysia marginata]|uniref:Polycystin-1-like n=1 Tax=Elysia marginata TaxID=1093978 RepID=A0AAV4FHQ0_9GAST|nr:polycystin-1-like [Elysia marginata]
MGNVGNLKASDEKSCNAKMRPVEKVPDNLGMEFIFTRTGIFSASVHASNAYDLLEKNITIVVIDQHIRNVSAQLKIPSRAVVSTEEILVFQLQAFTADRNFTIIRVDFGDGVVKTASVRERQSASLHRYDPQMVTLLADYGDGCTLSLKFDHQYLEEGIFSPLITLFNNVSSVTVELERPLFLVHEIKDILIESPELGAKDTRIAFSVRLNKTSENATADWYVYDKNGKTVANMGSKSTGLEVFLTFRETGRYKVVCNTFNAVSFQTESTHIMIHNIQQPVQGLRLSCNQGSYLEIEQEISCKAFVESGEDVAFVWDFQEESNVTYIDELGERGSIAKHTFLSPGSYNIRVRAYNVLNELTQSLGYNVHVEVAVGCLNVRTSAPALPGVPVIITATASTGSDLFFDLELSDENGNLVDKDVKRLDRQVAIRNGTTFFSESVIIPKPAGHHIVRVRAWNHISNTSATVGITIRERPPRFHIVAMPSPSTSVVSLAIQTPDGALLYREDLIFSFQFRGEAPHLTQVPLVTRDLHSDYPEPALASSSPPPPSSSTPPPATSSSSSSSSSSSYVLSENAFTAKSVSEKQNWLLVEGAALTKAARSRTVSHDQGIREETQGRGRRFRRVSWRAHGERTGESKGKAKNSHNNEGLDLAAVEPGAKQITTGPAEGGEGTAGGRKRHWSRPEPEAHVPPTPGPGDARTRDTEAAVSGTGTLPGSARLASNGEQQTPVAGADLHLDLVHISVASDGEYN